VPVVPVVVAAVAADSIGATTVAPATDSLRVAVVRRHHEHGLVRHLRRRRVLYRRQRRSPEHHFL
jgi:hypothetical protein